MSICDFEIIILNQSKHRLEFKVHWKQMIPNSLDYRAIPRAETLNFAWLYLVQVGLFHYEKKNDWQEILCVNLLDLKSLE